jgi:hypothetical protein
MASAAFAIVARCAPRCRERVMRPGERRRHDVRMHHPTHTAPAPQGPLHAALHAAQPRSRPRPSAARPRVLTAVSSVPRTRAASGHGPSATSVATRARTRRASARHSIRTCSARTTMHCAANSDVRARDARRLDVPPRYHPGTDRRCAARIRCTHLVRVRDLRCTHLEQARDLRCTHLAHEAASALVARGWYQGVIDAARRAISRVPTPSCRR